jgi:hypothetical protein
LLALVVDRCGSSRLSGRLAMQKVEGSSPFIRFDKSPANRGFFFDRTAESFIRFGETPLSWEVWQVGGRETAR